MTLLHRADLERPSPELPASTATLRPWLVAWLGLPVLGSPTAPSGTSPNKRVAGELAAHQLSTATLLVLMAAYLWALERRWPIQTSRRALTIGGSWAVLTILFEFGFGRYVAGDSWATLLHAYNLAEGRVWASVPLFTVVGPEAIRRLRSRR